MGYSYSIDSRTGRQRLDCDICGTPGARKYRCPFGWCQSIASCKKCRKEKPEYFSKAYHRSQGCELYHMQFVERQNREEELKQQGQYVRCSALGKHDGSGMVHVLFMNGERETIGYLMHEDVYNSLPLIELTVPADYMKFGKLIAAAPDFETGKTTKQVSIEECIQ